MMEMSSLAFVWLICGFLPGRSELSTVLTGETVDGVRRGGDSTDGSRRVKECSTGLPMSKVQMAGRIGEERRGYNSPRGRLTIKRANTSLYYPSAVLAAYGVSSCTSPFTSDFNLGGFLSSCVRSLCSPGLRSRIIMISYSAPVNCVSRCPCEAAEWSSPPTVLNSGRVLVALTSDVGNH